MRARHAYRADHRRIVVIFTAESVSPLLSPRTVSKVALIKEPTKGEFHAHLRGLRRGDSGSLIR